MANKSWVRCRFVFSATVFLSLGVCGVKAASAFEGNLEKEFQVKPGQKLVIDADRGSIAVSSGASGKVAIRVFREVEDTTKAKADEVFARHAVTFEQNGDSVVVTARSKSDFSSRLSFRPPQLQVRYEVAIPREFNVELKTAGGDIRLKDLDGYAITKTSSGSIQLGNVTGEITAANAGGNISVQTGGAKVAAQTSSGTIEIVKARGPIDASNSGGNVRIGEAEDTVTARTSSGSISIRVVKGDVQARNSGGGIEIDSAGAKVAAETSSGTIRLGSAGNGATLKNSGGSIAVGKVEGPILAETSSGLIQIEKVSGKAQVKNSGGPISLGEAGSDVIAQTSSGAINIKSAAGTVEIRNSGGNVGVGEAGGESNIRTSSGIIKMGEARGKVTARNAGGGIEIGEAHAAVLAETSSGQITVGFAKAPESECQLKVSGGGINVALPSDAAVNLDAQSSGGKVVSELPVAVVGEVKSNSRALQGKINGGGPPLVLQASAGDIRLEKARTSSGN